MDWSAISSSAVKVVQGIASGVVSSGMGLFSGVVSGVDDLYHQLYIFYLCIVPEGKAGRAGKAGAVCGLFEAFYREVT